MQNKQPIKSSSNRKTADPTTDRITNCKNNQTNHHTVWLRWDRPEDVHKTNHSIFAPKLHSFSLFIRPQTTNYKTHSSHSPKTRTPTFRANTEHNKRNSNILNEVMASDLDPDSGPHHKLQKKEKITTRSHCGDRGTLFFKNYDPPLHHQPIPRSAFPFQIADHRAIMPLCPSSPRQSPSSPPRTQTGKARSHKETQ